MILHNYRLMSMFFQKIYCVTGRFGIFVNAWTHGDQWACACGFFLEKNRREMKPNICHCTQRLIRGSKQLLVKENFVKSVC
jgi:hypothetical protein